MTDSNIKYLNLKDLIGANIFRIPDYQRGFAWEDKHFDALWNDLLNLYKGKLAYHYTGMITVERIKEKDFQHWEDAFYFEEYKGYFVVDGQQRLTSVSILLYEMIQAYFDQPIEEGQRLKLLDKSKHVWMEDYFIRHKDKDYNDPTFIFGYDTDNPSDLFFRVCIMEHPRYLPEGVELEKTAYTNQLLSAKQFFHRKIQEFLVDHDTGKPTKKRYEKLAQLCQLLTKRLMFDFKILDKSLDIFMVFETMNTRGKSLSNLEKLKNRLVYLSTLLQRAQLEAKGEYPTSMPNYRENALRSDIVNGWKAIYMELGRNERLLNSDDNLLNQHWIMYDNRPQKRDGMYVEDLFDKRFTVSKVVHEKVNAKTIRDYVDSLVEASQWWYTIYFPNSPKAKEYVSAPSITYQMIRINRLSAQYRYFVPLVFAALASDRSMELKKDVFVAIERYLFLVFSLSRRRSNTGSSHFTGLASQIYNKTGGWDNLHWAEESLYEWIHGGEDYDGYFKWQLFKQAVDGFFEHPHSGGYQEWKELKYFLSEYYSPIQPLDAYDQYRVVKIYNGERVSDGLSGWTTTQRSYLERSLGNFALVNNPPRNWSSFRFEDQKIYLQEHQPDHDLLQYDIWNAEAIAERGKKMLTFLENHWETHHSKRLNEAEQLDLLYLNFINVETE